VTGLGRILAVFTTPARELLALTEQQHPTPKPGYCDHLSHTALGTFLACQQRFAFHYEQQLTPAIAAEPLALGRAFAHALESDLPGGRRDLSPRAGRPGAGARRRQPVAHRPLR
jgi:hypothetical protein